MKTIIIDINGTPYDSINKPLENIAAKNIDDKFFMILSNPNGNLFNPMEIGVNIKQRDRERGGLYWRLHTCSRECFDQYTAFLRSKNRTHYLISQRRFLNDF
jgi:hypothetical protein